MSKQMDIAQAKVKRFNKDNPVGTRVRVWTLMGCKGEIKCITRTLCTAQIVGETAVIWCDGVRGCWAIDALEVLRDEVE